MDLYKTHQEGLLCSHSLVTKGSIERWLHATHSCGKKVAITKRTPPLYMVKRDVEIEIATSEHYGCQRKKEAWGIFDRERITSFR